MLAQSAPSALIDILGSFGVAPHDEQLSKLGGAACEGIAYRGGGVGGGAGAGGAAKRGGVESQQLSAARVAWAEERAELEARAMRAEERAEAAEAREASATSRLIEIRAEQRREGKGGAGKAVGKPAAAAALPQAAKSQTKSDEGRDADVKGAEGKSKSSKSGNSSKSSKRGGEGGGRGETAHAAQPVQAPSQEEADGDPSQPQPSVSKKKNAAVEGTAAAGGVAAVREECVEEVVEKDGAPRRGEVPVSSKVGSELSSKHQEAFDDFDDGPLDEHAPPPPALRVQQESLAALLADMEASTLAAASSRVSISKTMLRDAGASEEASEDEASEEGDEENDGQVV